MLPLQKAGRFCLQQGCLADRVKAPAIPLCSLLCPLSLQQWCQQIHARQTKKRAKRSLPLTCLIRSSQNPVRKNCSNIVSLPGTLQNFHRPSLCGNVDTLFLLQELSTLAVQILIINITKPLCYVGKFRLFQQLQFEVSQSCLQNPQPQ